VIFSLWLIEVYKKIIKQTAVLLLSCACHARFTVPFSWHLKAAVHNAYDVEATT